MSQLYVSISFYLKVSLVITCVKFCLEKLVDLNSFTEWTYPIIYWLANVIMYYPTSIIMLNIKNNPKYDYLKVKNSEIQPEEVNLNFFEIVKGELKFLLLCLAINPIFRNRKFPYTFFISDFGFFYFQ